MPRPHFTPRKDPVPIVQEAGWALGLVWTGGKSRPHRDFFLIHPCLLPYYCYIPIHILSTLPRIRRTGRSFCTICHTLTVLPPPIITHTEAFETVLSLSLYAPVVAAIRSRTVQPVVSRYTDWATQAHKPVFMGHHNSTWDAFDSFACFVQISSSNCVIQLLQQFCFIAKNKQRVTSAHGSRVVNNRLANSMKIPISWKVGNICVNN